VFPGLFDPMAAAEIYALPGHWSGEVMPQVDVPAITSPFFIEDHKGPDRTPPRPETSSISA
jgi:hypothetical protein